MLTPQKANIIIVLYNAKEFVFNCVNSIHKTLGIGNISLTFLNNDSNQKEYDNVSKENSYSNFIHFIHNLGFAKANNIGVKKSSSEYLCFLNPDTLLKEDFISPIIEFIKEHPKTGACAPMLMYEDNSYQASTGFKMGFLYEFLEATMLIKVYRKYIKQKYLKLKVSRHPVKVGWVSGACMIIKRSVFEEVGGFTEDYFLNYEDIDLCHKLEEKGYSNYYFPQYKCIHLDHKSFDSNYELLIFTRYQSRLIYAKRYYSAISSIFVRIMHILGLFLRIILVFFLYKDNELKSRKSGYFKALKLYLFNLK